MSMQPVRILNNRSARPPAFEQFQRELGLPYGDDFSACRKLIALVEAAAPLLNELDRVQVSRLMSSTAHAILLTCDGKRY
jgi:hypothetical protein